VTAVPIAADIDIPVDISVPADITIPVYPTGIAATISRTAGTLAGAPAGSLRDAAPTGTKGCATPRTAGALESATAHAAASMAATPADTGAAAATTATTAATTAAASSLGLGYLHKDWQSQQSNGQNKS
jgi:hypothetical protein